MCAGYGRGVADYVIRGGDEGYQRLLLLARDRRDDTLAWLRRAEVHAGQRGVDVGCGGGEVTFDLAALVDPAIVVGLDMDAVKLEYARQAAAERGVSNVEFQVADVTEWNEPTSYDVVYCRFLLQHLAEPVAMLRTMWAAVRPAGTLIVEDADFDGWCCYPPCAAFDFFVRTYSQTLDHRGGDHTSGRKLYQRFAEAGIPTPAHAVVQSTRTDETKTLAWSTLNATADAIVTDGIATRQQLDAALRELQHYTDDPTTLIVGPRIFQYYTHRTD